VSFANDGTGTTEQTTSVRVQSDSGVQRWGLLSFPYRAAEQTIEIEYVRVVKADGRTVVTPEDNVQDLDSEITRAAPLYSDQRGKHVVDGADELRPTEKIFSSATNPLEFPSGSSARIVRRGLLDCRPSSGCEFVLLPIDSVTSVN